MDWNEGKGACCTPSPLTKNHDGKFPGSLLNSHYPVANHAEVSCPALYLLRRIDPSATPNRVHFLLRLVFGYDPSPVPSQVKGSLSSIVAIPFAQTVQEGFEPARYVRCETHLGGLLRGQNANSRRRFVYRIGYY